MKNLSQKIMEAMKSGESQKLSVLRAIKTELTNLSLQKGRGGREATEQETFAVLRKMIAQRNDSAEMFLKGGRQELATKETQEAEMLAAMLPASLSAIEVTQLVLQAVSKANATTRRETGAAMKVAVELAAGRVDNKTLAAEIQRILRD